MLRKLSIRLRSSKWRKGALLPALAICCLMIWAADIFGLKPVHLATAPVEAIGGYSQVQPWRISEERFRSAFDSFRRDLEADIEGLRQEAETHSRLLPSHMLSSRITGMVDALQSHRMLFESILESAAKPLRKQLDIVYYPGTKFDSRDYSKWSQVVGHLYRDWSMECQPVHEKLYVPVVEALKNNLPPGKGTHVLVPGSALSRLASEIQAAGFQVEANELSGMFLTVADFLFNRLETSFSLYPAVHLLSDTYDHDDLLSPVQIPSPVPARVLGRKSAEGNLNTTSTLRIVAGDFVQLYKKGGFAHRKFKAVVTCFFLDIGHNIIDFIETIDGVLEDGGVWVNLGPLRYRGSVKLKLNWKEIEAIFTGLGYEFIHSSKIFSSYSFPEQRRLSKNMYSSVFTVSKKKRRAV